MPVALSSQEIPVDPTHLLIEQYSLPRVSNQEVNRGLKLIAEICGIKNSLAMLPVYIRVKIARQRIDLFNNEN
jgi:hypothetical protein